MKLFPGNSFRIGLLRKKELKVFFDFSLSAQIVSFPRLNLHCSHPGKLDRFSKPWFHLDSCIDPDQSPSLKRVHQPQSSKSNREWESNLQIWIYSQVSTVQRLVRAEIRALGARFSKGATTKGKVWNENQFNSTTVPSSQTGQLCFINW